MGVTNGRDRKQNPVYLDRRNNKSSTKFDSQNRQRNSVRERIFGFPCSLLQHFCWNWPRHNRLSLTSERPSLEGFASNQGRTKRYGKKSVAAHVLARGTKMQRREQCLASLKKTRMAER